jgi:hypothetical protein
MNRQTMERKKRIDKIRNTIMLVEEKGMNLDNKSFIIEICSDFGCSSRVAKEYIQTAEFQINYRKQELRKRKTEGIQSQE